MRASRHLLRAAGCCSRCACRCSGIYPVFMMKLLCFAMFACAFNLLLGFGGMLSFGHAAFFGSAAYATAWLVTAHGWGTAPAILGRRRRRGARSGLVDRRDRDPPPRHLFRHDHAGAGAAGVLRLPARRPSPAARTACRACRAAVCSACCRSGPTWCMYYLVLAAFVAEFLFIRRVVHSPFGQVLKAIRENEPRAISLGYDVNRYKLLAFVLSATLAGSRRLAEGPGAGLRDAVGRAAGDLGRSHPDDAARRHRAPSSARWSAQPWSSRCRSICPTSSAAGSRSSSARSSSPAC